MRVQAIEGALGWRWDGQPVVVRMRAPLAVVLGTVVVALSWHAALGLGGWHGLGGFRDPLTQCAVAFGAAATVVCAVAGRMRDDRRLTWIAAAMALHLVAVPVSMAWAGGGPELTVRSAQLAAFGAGLVLLVVAGRPPTQVVARRAKLVAIVAGLLMTVAIVVVASPVMFALQAGTVLAEIVLLGWCVLTTRLIALEFARGEPASGGLAVGLLVMSAAHLADVAAGGGSIQQDTAFHTVRLVGVLVVLFGALAILRQALDGLRCERGELEDDLRIAAVSAQRASRAAAERDHELRNGLTGLHGAIDTLGAGSDDADHERLRMAAMREIFRLSAMVERTARPATAGSYDVSTTVAEVTALRTACGVSITLECPPGLWAAGTASTFIQVITNVIGNCVRHAPGAPVSLRCFAVGAMIVVRVVDEGPGPPPGFTQLNGVSGVRSSSAGGEGLGLHISSTLLAGEGGRLQLLPIELGRRGCTVVIELPRATPDRAAVPRSQDMAVRTS